MELLRDEMAEFCKNLMESCREEELNFDAKRNRPGILYALPGANPIQR